MIDADLPESRLPASRHCALIGSGGHARVAADTLTAMGLTLSAVHDSDPSRVGALFGDVRIQADLVGAGLRQAAGGLHIAIGDNAVRRRIDQGDPGLDWIALIHPLARIASDVRIGGGSLIALSATLQVGVRIGRHVIVNTAAIVDHDSRIEDFAHVAPGAILTGGVQIGQGALIGAGAVVLPGLSIGAWAVVGAGAVVDRPVPDGAVVMGVPARPARDRR